MEGVKHSDNKIREQESAYFTLLQSYNSLLNDTGNNPSAALEESTSLGVSAKIRPEIIEYNRRGYKIVDDTGNLIPLDMNALAEIRQDLNLD